MQLLQELAATDTLRTGKARSTLYAVFKGTAMLLLE